MAGRCAEAGRGARPKPSGKVSVSRSRSTAASTSGRRRWPPCAGARCFVAGSAVFHQPDPAEAVRRIHASRLGGDLGPAPVRRRRAVGRPAVRARTRGRRTGDLRLQAKVCTVSDGGVVAGVREDRSGAAVAERLAAAGYEVIERRVVADGIESVAAAIAELADGFAGLDRHHRRHGVRASGPHARGHVAGARPAGARPRRGDAAGQPAGPPLARDGRDAGELRSCSTCPAPPRAPSNASRRFSTSCHTRWTFSQGVGRTDLVRRSAPLREVGSGSTSPVRSPRQEARCCVSSSQRVRSSMQPSSCSPPPTWRSSEQPTWTTGQRSTTRVSTRCTFFDRRRSRPTWRRDCSTSA